MLGLLDQVLSFEGGRGTIDKARALRPWHDRRRFAPRDRRRDWSHDAGDPLRCSTLLRQASTRRFSPSSFWNISMLLWVATQRRLLPPGRPGRIEKFERQAAGSRRMASWACSRGSRKPGYVRGATLHTSRSSWPCSRGQRRDGDLRARVQRLEAAPPCREARVKAPAHHGPEPMAVAEPKPLRSPLRSRESNPRRRSRPSLERWRRNRSRAEKTQPAELERWRRVTTSGTSSSKIWTASMKAMSCPKRRLRSHGIGEADPKGRSHQTWDRIMIRVRPRPENSAFLRTCRKRSGRRTSSRQLSS